ncbi:hypothetical protein [Vibrio phage RYC]|nr:hypothetical protein [Vibrio phage RYC]
MNNLVKYNSEPLKRALQNFDNLFDDHQAILKDLVKACEEDFVPSRFQRLRGIKTLRDLYRSQEYCRWGYRSFLYYKGYYTLDNEQCNTMVELGLIDPLRGFCYGDDIYYNQVVGILSPESDEYYLSQGCAEFVKKYNKGGGK